MNATSSASQSDWLIDFPPPRSLFFDQEALRVYERAYYIGLSTEPVSESPITFSTVALALLTGLDDTSQWFARRAKVNGPFAGAVSSAKGTTIIDLPPLTQPAGRPAQIRLSSDKQLLTASARALVETAEEWATRVEGTDIGVRHLVASYVINPPAAHRKQMNDWGFKERAWRDEFFDWITTRYTAESWSSARQKVVPTKALASFEGHKIKGAALAFPGDAQTMQVLKRAAEYHARRSDTWLRLQTVFFALVDEGRADTDLGAEILPILSAVSPIESAYATAFEAYLPATATSKGVIPFDALDISPRVLNGLETARELTLATRNTGEDVGVLHLAGALVSRRVDGDDQLAATGFEPQALRLALIACAATQGESGEVWREALGEEEAVPMGRPVDLNSDEPEAVVRADQKWASDPLGIRPDVTSFAALLASKSLEPPLAIGLFGPWGSGKTTFLKRLHLAIDERASQAKAAHAASQHAPFVNNVVHVEFNAWHFAEDALISSLVDTIVREIKSFIKNDYPQIGEALVRLRSETVETSRRRVESARLNEARARKAVADAATALSESEANARKGAANLQVAVQVAWDATLKTVGQSPVVKQSGVLDSLGTTVSNLEDLQRRVQAIRSRPRSMLSQLGWRRTLLFAALVLALPVLVAWLVQNVLEIGGLGQALTSAGAILSVVGVWLRAASGAAAKVEQAIAEVTQAYEKQIQSDPKVANAQKQVHSAASEAASAAEELATSERELRSAEADAAAASLPSQMLTLVSGRADDMTYAKELTTVSIARGDLQKLSQILREQVEAATAAGSSGARAVDRVILYIDDLDRCRPEDVVRVLQVVHMLLAFELFVVVVAVDARWVEESLKQNYRWLGSGKGAGSSTEGVGAGGAAESNARVTPQDYLEKIFQISFWLEPMTAGRAAEYLKSLVRTGPRDPEDGIRLPSGADGASSAPTTDGAGKVEIRPIELDYMRALATYVGPSPRRVKRFVNAYRLLKARMSDAELSGFVTDRSTDEGGLRSGPYQLVVGLLVIGTGAPSSASQILKELAERDPRDRMDEVIDSFRERQHPDWKMAAQVLETLVRTQKARDVSELRGWARRVSRFLLQGPTVALQHRSVDS
ncbi:KAP family NTPase [Variovorax sp. LjRoot175]|uniref:P-loop NTPase fold protein n=1 Tax=Variovorax sp. LjRoot175 TaxID=3342276 RepID=UPI003ECF6092